MSCATIKILHKYVIAPNIHLVQCKTHTINSTIYAFCQTWQKGVYNMSYTSTEVKARWNAKHYDQLSIVLPKGSAKLIKEYANSQGMSASEYIRHLIAQDAPQCLTYTMNGGGGR